MCVRLDLGVGGGLDGDGEEVVGVVSCDILGLLQVFDAIKELTSLYIFNHSCTCGKETP